MIRRPPRSTQSRSSAASDVYKRQAAAVAGLPTTFQYTYQHSASTARQNNGDWGLTVSVGRFGVADREGGTGLPFQSDGVADPRVADTLANRVGTAKPTKGFDGATDQFCLLYTSPSP